MTILFRMIRLAAESVGIKRNYPFHVFLNAIFWRKSLFEENKTTHKKSRLHAGADSRFEIIILQR